MGSETVCNLCVYFSRIDSGLCMYHLVVWSNFNLLHNSQWIIFPIQSNLILYSFYVCLLHSLPMLSTILPFSPHYLHLLFCWVLSIFTSIIMCHHVVLVAWIPLTLSRHFSLLFIASGRSSEQHPVSSHSCWMYFRAGRPAFAQPCVGFHKSTSLMSSSLLLQQCPAAAVLTLCFSSCWVAFQPAMLAVARIWPSVSWLLENFLRPQGAFPPGFYLLWEGWVNRLVPETPLIRGMLMGP